MSRPSEYIYRGDHAQPLTSGLDLAPGDTVPASELQDADQYLIDDGVLFPVDEIEELPSNTPTTGDELADRAKALGISGRSRMNREQLQAAVAEAEAAEGGDA